MVRPVALSAVLLLLAAGLPVQFHLSVSGYLMRFLLRFFMLASLLLAMAACAPKAEVKLDLKGTDMSDTQLGGDFSLTDHQGKPRKLSDFSGKVVALFFGYTHCPDVCPTTMLEYATVMKKLGADADKVQVLFVTVDPERDTSAVLAAYVPHFDPRFVGLSGTPAQIDTVKSAYKVVAQKVAGADGSYTVDHSAGSYLFDKSGKLRVYEAYGTPADSLAHDIRQLLR
jgi:protein SCO1/2